MVSTEGDRLITDLRAAANTIARAIEELGRAEPGENSGVVSPKDSGPKRLELNQARSEPPEEDVMVEELNGLAEDLGLSIMTASEEQGVRSLVREHEVAIPGTFVRQASASTDVRSELKKIVAKRNFVGAAGFLLGAAIPLLLLSFAPASVAGLLIGSSGVTGVEVAKAFKQSYDRLHRPPPDLSIKLTL